MSQRKVKEYRRLLRNRYSKFLDMIKDFSFKERLRLAWTIICTRKNENKS